MNYSISDKDLKDLVGKSFHQEGFYSSCAVESNPYGSLLDVQIRTYCPRGTKALPVESFSHYSSEKEIILQRGYEYRITKAEKKGGRVYLDVEVVLGSDEKRYNHDELEIIKNKYGGIYA